MTEQAKPNCTPATFRPRALKLAAVEAAGLLAIGSLAYLNNGIDGLVVSLIAAVLCWLGAVVAFLATNRPADPQQAVAMVYTGIFFRGAIPMVAGFALVQIFPHLTTVGLMSYIVPFYLLTLASETYFTVGELRPHIAHASRGPNTTT